MSRLATTPRRTSALLLCLAITAFALPAEASAIPQCEPARPRLVSATEFPPELQAALDAAVRAELSDAQPFPGLSVGVQHGTRRWTAGYGHRDVARRLPATPLTTYRFASITKSFTAIAVMQLVEQGRLALDQDLRSLVPWYPAKQWPITVRQLLGHLSGVPHYAGAKDGRNLKRLDTRAAIALFADKPLVSEPGSAFVYTSNGYNLLGAAVESASGQGYARYLATHVFGPSGMRTAALDDLRTRSSHHAVGYRRRGTRLERSERLDVSSRFAGGGTRGSVLDLLAFGKAVLDHRLVSASATARMQTVMRTVDGRFTDYGMGFATFPRHGQYLVAHAGGQPETSTLLALLPADELTIALATNLEGQADLLRRIQIRIAELLLEDGRVRRDAYAKDPIDRGVYEALYRVFSYGVAYSRWSQRASAELPIERGGEGESSEAFEQVRSLLSRAEIAASPKAHRERLRGAHEPRGGGVVLHVGVEMARTIQRWRGPLALQGAAERGPLRFFLDYAAACEALECPKARRFDEVRADVERMARSWEAGSVDELERARWHDVTDPERLFERVSERLAVSASAVSEASFRPDYAEELSRLARRARDRGDARGARRWLERAVALHTGTAEPLLALGDFELERGERAAGLARYQQALREDPTAEALEPEALEKRAREAGSKKLAAEIRAVAVALHPER